MQLKKILEPGDKFMVKWIPNTEDSPSDMSDYDDHWLEVHSNGVNRRSGGKGLGHFYRAVWKKENNPGKMNPGSMGDNTSRTAFVWYEWNMCGVRYAKEPFPPENPVEIKQMLPYV